MGDHRSTCMQLKESLEQKQNKLNDVMVRIGPSEPLSDSIFKVLAGIFEDHDEDLPSDDDEDPSENQIKEVIDALVNRSNELPDSDTDTREDEDMYHLKILQDDAGDAGDAGDDGDDGDAATDNQSGGAPLLVGTFF
jgi:hypothetical protein